MKPTLRNLLMTTALAWQITPTLAAGAVADAHEMQVPARAGVAVEPSHRAQVIAPGIKPSSALGFSPVWVVTEPARQRVLLPGEERAVLDFLALQANLEDAAAKRASLGQGAHDDQPQQADVAGGRVAATVYFPFDSSRPINGSAINDYLRSITPATQGLKITGHTDSTGSERYNLGLSLKRANSVAKIFSANGVSRARLTIEGKGESETTGSQDPSRDRRVEVSIVPEAVK